MDEAMEIDQDKEQKNVRFKTKNENTDSLLVDEKSATVLTTRDYCLDTQLREEGVISNLKTVEEITAYSDLLFVEIDDCERMKQEGYDKTAIRAKIEEIKNRFKLLNEVKQRVENQKEKERKTKRNMIETPLYQGEEAKAHKLDNTLNHEIYSYLKELNCDLVLMFHCCTIDADVEQYVFKLEEVFEKNAKVRISIFDAGKKGLLRFSKLFLDRANYKSLSFETKTRDRLEDIQNHFIGLKWSKHSLRVVCNVVNLECKHDAKNIKKFIASSSDDPFKSLMEYNKIQSFTFFVDKHFDEKYKSFDSDWVVNVDHVFADHCISEAVEVVSQRSLMKHVYSLKRSHFANFDEFLKLLKSRVNNVDNNKIDMSFEAISLIYKGIVNLESVLSEEKIMLKDLQNDSETTSHIEVLDRMNPASKSYSIFSAKVNWTSGIWLEMFKDQRVALSMYDIYLTARLFVLRFNERMSSECIHLSNSCVYSVVAKPDLMLYTQCFEYGFGNSSPNTKIQSNELLQAFIHFTFEESRKTMVVFDLRPFEDKEKKELLFTEPVIFSTFERRYGMSNLGTEAMNHLMELHECNGYCDRVFKNGSNAKSKTNVVKEGKKLMKKCALM